jgi:hypothetical protein
MILLRIEDSPEPADRWQMYWDSKEECMEAIKPRDSDRTDIEVFMEDVLTGIWDGEFTDDSDEDLMSG